MVMKVRESRFRGGVGLGTGGLDMQDIRKSFFLLDFPLDWGMPAGWLEAGDSIVQAGPGATEETNPEGSELDWGGAGSWLRAGGPGAVEE